MFRGADASSVLSFSSFSPSFSLVESMICMKKIPFSLLSLFQGKEIVLIDGMSGKERRQRKNSENERKKEEKERKIERMKGRGRK